jgi:CDGSH-type Zn-finger protein
MSDVAAEIVVFADGPYLVRGPFDLVHAGTGEVVTARSTVALCGCGRSRTPPLCDGSHKHRRIRDAAAARNDRGDDAARRIISPR